MRVTTLEERLAARREQALTRWMIGCGPYKPHPAPGPKPEEKPFRRPRRRGAALLAVILVVLWLIAYIA